MDRVSNFLTAGVIAAFESLAVVSAASPTELNSRVGTIGQKVLVYQVAATGDIATLYAWDAANSGGVSAPYVMAASDSGFWYAVAGRYCNSAATINGAVTFNSTLNVTGAAVFASTLGAGVTTLASGSVTGAWSIGTTLGVTGLLTASATGTAISALGDITVASGKVYKVNAVQVLAARITGWGTPTSTLARTTFATYAGQTHSVGYVQAEAQALDDHVKILSQRLGALITDIIAHGAIGP